MDALTHILLLPSDITLAIFGAVVRKDVGSISKDVNFSPENTKSLLTIGHVCQSWRNIILNILCSQHIIIGDISKNNTITVPSNYLKSDEFINAHAVRVRQLSIHINIFGAGDNGLDTSFASLMDSNVCYVSARSVNISFEIHGSCCAEDAMAAMNNSAARIIKVVKKLVPNMQRVNIWYASIMLNTSDDVFNGITVNLLEDISRHTTLKSTSLNIGGGMFVSSFEHKISNLTRLQFNWNKHNDMTLRFARANAGSIQDMIVSHICTEGIEGIFKDNDSSECIVYPYMTKLCLLVHSSYENHIPESRPVFKNFVPFPRLERFITDLVYPFGDDVLFRGNTRCLKHLELNFDHKSMAALTKSMQLSGSSFQSLKHVAMHTFVNDIDSNQVFVSQSAALLISTRQALEYICISDYDISDAFIKQLDPKTPFQNVCTLHLNMFKASLFDIFKILKCMPAVQMISSGLMEVLNFDQAIATFGWLERLCEKYGVLHRNIQYWRLHFEYVLVGVTLEVDLSEFDKAVHYSIIYASILAILCPNFRGIWIKHEHMPEYIAGIKKNMEEAPFNAFSQQLEKLLGIGVTY